MTKDQFLAQLTHRLSYLPYEEIKKTTDFYREAIDDRMEEGLSEEEAVAAMGSLDDIERELVQTLPLAAAVRERVKSEREKAEERAGGRKGLLWLLILLGFPLWIALAAVVFALAVSAVAVVFALVVTVTAVAGALIVMGAVMVATTVLPSGSTLAGRLMIGGGGLTTIGLGLLLLPLVKLLFRGLRELARAAFRGVKKLILGKKEAQA